MFPLLPHLPQATDISLFFLRLMVGAVFIGSGYADLKDPDRRSKSIEASKNFTIFLGMAELLGGLAVILGVLIQLAAAGLILVMLGALQKKIFVWKTGYWGKDGVGWNYELILISILLVIIVTNGGNFVLLR